MYLPRKNKTEGEGDRIIKHVAHRDAIYNHIEKKAKKRVDEAEEYAGSAIELVVPYTLEKQKLNNAESATMLNLFYDNKGISPDEIKERKPIVPDTPYHNKEKFLKSTKKEAGVHTTVATYDVIE
jgi:hypothetical protein